MMTRALAVALLAASLAGLGSAHADEGALGGSLAGIALAAGDTYTNDEIGISFAELDGWTVSKPDSGADLILLYPGETGFPPHIAVETEPRGAGMSLADIVTLKGAELQKATDSGMLSLKSSDDAVIGKYLTHTKTAIQSISTDSKDVTIVYRQVIVEAQSQFIIFTYVSSSDTFGKHMPAFEQVLSTLDAGPAPLGSVESFARTYTDETVGLSFTAPKAWIVSHPPVGATTMLLYTGEPDFSPRITLEGVPRSAGMSLADIIALKEAELQKSIEFQKSIDGGTMSLQSADDAIVGQYAAHTKMVTRELPADAGDLTVLYRQTIVETPEQFLIFLYVNDEKTFDKHLPAFEQVLTTFEFASAPAPARMTEPISGTYTDAKLGISFLAPTGWHSDKSTDGPSTVLVFPGPPPLTPHISVEAVPKEIGMTLASIVEIKGKEFQDAADKGLVLKSADDAVIGKYLTHTKTASQEFESPIGQISAAYRQVIVEASNQFLVFLYVSPPDTFDTHLPALEQVLSTLDAGPAPPIPVDKAPRTYKDEELGIIFQAPQEWSASHTELGAGTILSLDDGSDFIPQIAISASPRDADTSLSSLIEMQDDQIRQDLSTGRATVYSSDDATIGKYLTHTKTILRTIPVEGKDTDIHYRQTIVEMPDRFLLFTYVTSEGSFDKHLPAFEEILSTLDASGESSLFSAAPSNLEEISGTYTDATLGISFLAPEGWYSDKSPDGPSTVLVFPGPPPLTPHISVEAVPKEIGMTLTSIVEIKGKEFQDAADKGLMLKSADDAVIGKYLTHTKTASQEFESPIGQISAAYRQVIVEASNQFLVFLYVSPPDTFNEHLPALEQVLSTLDAGPAPPIPVDKAPRLYEDKEIGITFKAPQEWILRHPPNDVSTLLIHPDDPMFPTHISIEAEPRTAYKDMSTIITVKSAELQGAIDSGDLVIHSSDDAVIGKYLTHTKTATQTIPLDGETLKVSYRQAIVETPDKFVLLTYVTGTDTFDRHMPAFEEILSTLDATPLYSSFTMESKKYADPDLGITFQGPSGWIASNPVDGPSTILLYPDDSLVPPHITIESEPRTEKLPLSSMVAIKNEELKKAMESGNLVLESSDDAVIGKYLTHTKRASQMISNDMVDVKVIYQQTIVEAPSQFLIFTFVTSDESFDKHLPALKGIINTLDATSPITPSMIDGMYTDEELGFTFAVLDGWVPGKPADGPSATLLYPDDSLVPPHITIETEPRKAGMQLADIVELKSAEIQKAMASGSLSLKSSDDAVIGKYLTHTKRATQEISTGEEILSIAYRQTIVETQNQFFIVTYVSLADAFNMHMPALESLLSTLDAGPAPPGSVESVARTYADESIDLTFTAPKTWIVSHPQDGPSTVLLYPTESTFPPHITIEAEPRPAGMQLADIVELKGADLQEIIDAGVLSLRSSDDAVIGGYMTHTKIAAQELSTGAGDTTAIHRQTIMELPDQFLILTYVSTEDTFDEHLPAFEEVLTTLQPGAAMGSGMDKPGMMEEEKKGMMEEDRPVMMEEDTSAPGGCLIATAAYGTELAPQVQALRELRDGVVLQTGTGSAFMSGFSAVYYSFSPAVADLERSSPAFKETVRAAITPMIWSLAILQHAEIDSEVDMAAYGIAAILANLAMYIGVPAAIVLAARHRLSRRA